MKEISGVRLRKKNSPDVKNEKFIKSEMLESKKGDITYIINRI